MQALVVEADKLAPRTRPWLVDLCLLLGLLLIVPLIYSPYLLHNLPVAANVDERTSLAVLERFDHGSLNPHFFMYPTLYYYLTYFSIAPFSAHHFLIAGRALNLSLVGLTAFAAYAFTKHHLLSRAAGSIAALAVITSTTITNSGAYLCTDVLLAAATMGSLYYLVEYFATGNERPWLLGMLLLGAAVGSKYTAFLLFLAYYATELVATLQRTPPSKTNTRFARTTLVSVLLACALAALTAAVFFPVQAALQFVAHSRSNADLRDPTEYLHFFAHIRRLLAEAAVLSLAAALATRFSRRVYSAVSPRRPYLGLLIVLLVSYLSTPYSLLDPKHFLYDLGALARSNIVVAGHQAEWRSYLIWLFTNENHLLLALSAAGLALLAIRPRPELRIAGIYLALYSLVIGSAHLGYPRYLTPLLPLAYCAAGFALVSLWNWHPSPLRWNRPLAALIALAISIQLAARIERNRELSRQSDAFLASYQLARNHTTGTDQYAGSAPSVELEAAGIPTRQVSWATLSSAPLSANLPCTDLLILDKQAAAQHAIDAANDPSVTLLLDDPRGGGQQVVRRKNCP